MAKSGSTSTAAEPAGRTPTDVSVLAVDDHDAFQTALTHLFDATPGFRLVGQTATGEEAIAAVDALDPDLVLMDVNMPGIGGVEATRAILADHPKAVVWLVSIEEADVLAALTEQCGAHAYVRKQELRPRLLRKMWARGRPS